MAEELGWWPPLSWMGPICRDLELLKSTLAHQVPSLHLSHGRAPAFQCHKTCSNAIPSPLTQVLLPDSPCTLRPTSLGRWHPVRAGELLHCIILREKLGEGGSSSYLA